MRRTRRGSRRDDNDAADEVSVESPDAAAAVQAPGTTGRMLVLLREGAGAAAMRAFSDTAGVSNMASTADFEGGVPDAEQLAGTEGLILEQLGIAVVDVPPDQMQAISSVAAADGDSMILATEPEQICYALSDGVTGGSAGGAPPVGASAELGAASAIPLEYFRGYRDAVNHLTDKILGTTGAEARIADDLAALNETELTWGLQVTRAGMSGFSGRDIRVAVLDTGMDLGHPDFAGRNITSSSFIQGQAVQDGHGHGTHCIGTACGPRQPSRLPRYGVAFESEIFAGKVLSNQGSGADEGILLGIQWAITNGCHIISMSLGSRVFAGQSFSPIYEAAAQRALAAGSLIIAAAGNDSNRPGSVLPVSRPANCPSIMAVAALDQQLQVAFFSNGGLNPQGGQVDIAGPGVDVLSTWPRPVLYNTISGTSMATPHVAGIAALWSQNTGARGNALGSLLLQRARRLDLPSRDVGSGLVQAPSTC